MLVSAEASSLYQSLATAHSLVADADVLCGIRARHKTEKARCGAEVSLVQALWHGNHVAYHGLYARTVSETTPLQKPL